MKLIYFESVTNNIHKGSKTFRNRFTVRALGVIIIRL